MHYLTHADDGKINPLIARLFLTPSDRGKLSEYCSSLPCPLSKILHLIYSVFLRLFALIITKPDCLKGLFSVHHQPQLSPIIYSFEVAQFQMPGFLSQQLMLYIKESRAEAALDLWGDRYLWSYTTLYMYISESIFYATKTGMCWWVWVGPVMVSFSVPASRRDFLLEQNIINCHQIKFM